MKRLLCLAFGLILAALATGCGGGGGGSEASNTDPPGNNEEPSPQISLPLGTVVDHLANNEIPYNWYSMIPTGLDPSKPITLLVTTGNAWPNYQEASEDSRIQAANFNWEGPASNNVVAISIALPRKQGDDGEIYCNALYSNTFTTSEEFYKRPDLKAVDIIQSAKEYLENGGFSVNPKVIMYGYSAQAMFAQRFTLLHPELVQMVVAGQAGGALIFPEENYNGFVMGWPVGVSDYEQYTGKVFNREIYRTIPQFFYIGDEDTGPYQWTIYSDVWGYNVWDYSEEQVHWFYDNFGNPQPVSFQNQANYMINEGYRVTFKLYQGVGHTINNEMMNDMWIFIAENL